jgi:hypothetical protein
VGATSIALAPGDGELVVVSWSNPPVGPTTVYVVADDDGTGQGAHNECDENNEAQISGLGCP